MMMFGEGDIVGDSVRGLPVKVFAETWFGFLLTCKGCSVLNYYCVIVIRHINYGIQS